MTESNGVNPQVTSSAGTESGGGQSGQPLGAGYRLFEVLGRGAMGEVRRGVTISGEPVAVKVLRPEFAEDPGIVSRFLQERAILTAVRHPNIVAVRDLVAEGTTLAIVMEYVAGPDLRTALTRIGPLPPSGAAELIAKLLDGLTAVHAAGVVHRDIKPENVLLDGVPPEVSDAAMVVKHPKLTDFGVSKFVGDRTSTRRTSVIGTPEYMAPELLDDSQPTVSSDLYATGIMLYELLCGVTPFGSGSPIAVMRRHTDQAPGRPEGIPDLMWSVICGLLAKDPSGRPQSAAQVAAELRVIAPQLAGIPAAAALSEPPPGNEYATVIKSLTGTAGTASSDKPSVAVAAPVPHQRGSRGKASRGKALAIGSAVAALIVGAGVITAVLIGGESGDSAVAVGTPVASPTPEPSLSTTPNLSTTPSYDPTALASQSGFYGPEESDSVAPSDSLSLTDDSEDSTAVRAGVMPDVRGQTMADAQSAMDAAGLEYTISQVIDASVPDGTILSQSPAAGAAVVGSAELTVARAAQAVWLADMASVAGNDNRTTAKVDGKVYVHSLVTQANCGNTYNLEYDLGRSFDTLTGLVGMTDRSAREGKVQVEIYRDGTRVFNKSVMLGRTQRFNEDMTGALRLRFVYTPTTCGSEYSYLALANPQLIGLPSAEVPADE